LFLVAPSYGKGMWVFICHKGGRENYMMIFGDKTKCPKYLMAMTWG
jgi:hypothetical protein